MPSSADLIFEYMRDLLYSPAKAHLDIDALEEEYKRVGQGLLYFAQCLEQQRELAASLSKGNLSVKLPPPDNQLAAPLKALHASLKHLTWTSQQVAKGDYQQRLDFMGEFADAFNTMTQQLEQRQKELEAEVENRRNQALALEQSNSLLEAITNELQQWIYVLDTETGGTLFLNATAMEALSQNPDLGEKLKQKLYRERLDEATEQEIELYFSTEKVRRYYSVVSYPVHWRAKRAIAHIIRDISDEKRHVQKLENYAYQDNLTGISNRYYGMQTLREWLEEKRCFSLSFVDLDNLKFVNDNYGHSEGDVYIISAAQLLTRRMEAGMVCRLGGDEFMILAPDATREDLERVMDEARDELIQQGRDKERPYLSSLSYGVVEVREDNNLSSGALLSLADERMYQFKRSHKLGRGKSLHRKGAPE